MVKWLGTPARVGITLNVCAPGKGLWFDPVQNKCVQKCPAGQEWDPIQNKCFTPASIPITILPEVPGSITPLPPSAQPQIAKTEGGSIVPILVVTAIGAAIFWAVIA